MNKALRLLREHRNAWSAGAATQAEGPPPSGPAESDPLAAFASENGGDSQAVAPRAHTPQAPDKPGKGKPAPSHSASARPPGAAIRVRWPAGASAFAAVVLAVGGLIWAYQQLIPIDAATPRPAKLTIVTQPAGADVLVNGALRGVTPLSMSLASGALTVTLRQGGEERVIPLTLAAGAEVEHHIEFAAPTSVVSAGGAMSVVTDPPGAQVEVDGRVRGVSPLSLRDLTLAEHKVRVSGNTGSAERTVVVNSGTTTSVVFSLPKVSSPLAGWIAVASPFDVSISEGGNLVATGRVAKIMLPAGRHTISLANDALQYETERTVDVAAGQTANLRVDAPKAQMSVNARPWADVVIDGAGVGQTPLANLPVTIGAHDILFRHPQLGDRRQTVVVTAKGPNRIAIDLTK